MVWRTQYNVPEVYPNESRDFQLMGRLLDCVVNSTKFNIDAICNLSNAEDIMGTLLPLLQNKLGFFSQENFTDDELREILMAFPYLIKYKGSKKSIDEAINLYVRLKGYDTKDKITWSIGKSGAFDMNSKYTIYIEIPFGPTSTTILDEIFRYILPTGFGAYYEFNQKVDIEVICDPLDAGSAEVTQTGNGAYNIKATPGEGYEVAYWEYYIDGVKHESEDEELNLEGITEDMVVYLHFGLPTYSIEWQNYDGTVLETDLVHYGAIPEYNGETPEKPSTEQKSYIFNGWNPDPEAVTKDATYVAQFTETARLYDITWKDDEDNVLKVTHVAYGEIPDYGGTPTKESTAQYSYTFDGWTPAVVEVTGDATYVAQFTATIRSYTINWKNWDGTILETDTNVYGTNPAYNGATPTRPSTAQATYTFDGWLPTPSTVVGNVDYVAQFTETQIVYYTITWKDWDNTTLRVDTVEAGNTPDYGSTPPSRPSTAQYTYTFTGWNPTVVVASEDKTYTAQYSSSIRTYTITWKDWDNSTLKTETLSYGATPDYGTPTPTRQPDAQYTYQFNGWSPTITQVTSNATYTATYTAQTRSYTITWNNWDDSLLRNDVMPYGATPDYGGTPSRPSDGTYTYTFAGWNPTVVDVESDATYTATYTPVPIITYTITYHTEARYGTAPSPQTSATNSFILSDATNSMKADALNEMVAFNGWRINNLVYYPDGQSTFSIPGGAVSIDAYATFVSISHVIALPPGEQEFGSDVIDFDRVYETEPNIFSDEYVSSSATVRVNISSQGVGETAVYRVIEDHGGDEEVVFYQVNVAPLQRRVNLANHTGTWKKESAISDRNFLLSANLPTRVDDGGTVTVTVSTSKYIAVKEGLNVIPNSNSIYVDYGTESENDSYIFYGDASLYRKINGKALNPGYTQYLTCDQNDSCDLVNSRIPDAWAKVVWDEDVAFWIVPLINKHGYFKMTFHDENDVENPAYIRLIGSVCNVSVSGTIGGYSPSTFNSPLTLGASTVITVQNITSDITITIADTFASSMLTITNNFPTPIGSISKNIEMYPTGAIEIPKQSEILFTVVEDSNVNYGTRTLWSYTISPGEQIRVNDTLIDLGNEESLYLNLNKSTSDVSTSSGRISNSWGTVTAVDDGLYIAPLSGYSGWYKFTVYSSEAGTTDTWQGTNVEKSIEIKTSAGTSTVKFQSGGTTVNQNYYRFATTPLTPATKYITLSNRSGNQYPNSFTVTLDSSANNPS